MFLALADIFRSWFNRVGCGALTLWLNALASVVDPVWRLVSTILSQFSVDRPLDGPTENTMRHQRFTAAFGSRGRGTVELHREATYYPLSALAPTTQYDAGNPMTEFHDCSSRCRPEPARPPPFINHATAP